MPKQKHYTMGHYSASDVQQKALLWCLERNIKIAPYAAGDGKWYVDVILKDKVHRGPNKYGPGEVWEVLFNYYSYYYEKRKSV